MKHLALEHVSVRFGRVQALDDVSVRLEAGECLMLVGPNGSGKSTLIRSLLGLVRPDAGALRVDGESRHVDNRFKSNVGYLPEAVAFAENLTGLQVLSFFAAARGTPKKRVQSVLDRVGLANAARRAVRGYSRGMRQRLGLGIAILAEPPLLILDEPTGGLDQEGLAVLWSVLADWRQSGRMALVATHDLTLMERRIDRMCVLRDGKLLADDVPSEIRKLAALPVSVAFSGTPAALDALAESLRAWGRAEAIEHDGATVRIEVDPEALLPALELGTKAEGVESVRVVEPGLDTVYERLLRGEA
jgi:Cu-processing system ATP-binding protein